MTLTIPENDFGKIRVFSLPDEPSDDAKDRKPDALAALLGTPHLNPDFVDVVEIEALDELGLMGLLEQGYDITPDAADARALQDLTGWAVLIMSRASAGAEVTLQLASGVKHVTTIGEQATLKSLPPLGSDATLGTIEAPTKPAKSDARIGGMVATFVLLFLFLLVAVMIWVGR